jgi:uncharacterized protein YwgA
MEPRHLILMLLKAYGGNITSKTKIQKMIYFISLILGEDLEFKPHYYGPYSIQVEQGLDELIGAGFVDVTRNIFGVDVSKGFEFKRYDFFLTNSGQKLSDAIEEDNREEYNKIKDFVGKLKSKTGDPDYLSLSIAAKAYFILEKEGKPMNMNAIKEKAKNFGWNVTKDDIDMAVNILKKLNFVTTEA